MLRQSASVTAASSFAKASAVALRAMADEAARQGRERRGDDDRDLPSHDRRPGAVSTIRQRRTGLRMTNPEGESAGYRRRTRGCRIRQRRLVRLGSPPYKAARSGGGKAGRRAPTERGGYNTEEGGQGRPLLHRGAARLASAATGWQPLIEHRYFLLDGALRWWYRGDSCLKKDGARSWPALYRVRRGSRAQLQGGRDGSVHDTRAGRYYSVGVGWHGSFQKRVFLPNEPN